MSCLIKQVRITVIFQDTMNIVALSENRQFGLSESKSAKLEVWFSGSSVVYSFRFNFFKYVSEMPPFPFIRVLTLVD